MKRREESERSLLPGGRAQSKCPITQLRLIQLGYPVASSLKKTFRKKKENLQYLPAPRLHLDCWTSRPHAAGKHADFSKTCSTGRLPDLPLPLPLSPHHHAHTSRYPRSEAKRFRRTGRRGIPSPRRPYPPGAPLHIPRTLRLCHDYQLTGAHRLPIGQR